tara:strand:- start:8615 stop:9742 length:1128 start_codon:yes stop_codon:yes gene_type:complete
MKFIISSEKFLKTIQPLMGVIINNPALPIIENLLIEVDHNILNVKATDLETTIINQTKIQSESNASIAVNAKLLAETLRTFPEQPLTFKTNTENKTLEIISDQGNYNISYIDSDEFPNTPEIAESQSISISGSTLSKGIQNTLFAAGNDELRPVMSGVYMEINTNTILMVATDAHKLVKYENKVETNPNHSASFICPKKPLQLLKNTISDDDNNIKIEYNKTNLIFSFENMQIYCRLIDGNYPNYQAVIPKENPNILNIERDKLLSSLKRISIFSSKSTHQIKLKVNGNSIDVSAEDIDFSNKGNETIKVDYDGQDMEIGFNGKFLIEILNTLQSEKINIYFSTPSKAAIIMPDIENEKIEKVLMLVMPVMLNQN